MKQKQTKNVVMSVESWCCYIGVCFIVSHTFLEVFHNLQNNLKLYDQV